MNDCRISSYSPSSRFRIYRYLIVIAFRIHGHRTIVDQKNLPLEDLAALSVQTVIDELSIDMVMDEM